MPYTIDRISLLAGPFNLTTNPATSAKLSISSFAGAFMFCGAGPASATVTWYVAQSLDDPAPAQAYAADGTAITTPNVQFGSPNKAYAVPDSLFGAQFLVPVLSTGSGQVTFSVKG